LLQVPIEDNVRLNETVTSLATNMMSDANLFAKQFSTRHEILAWLADHVINVSNGNAAIRIPVALVLLGKDDEARSAIEAKLAEIRESMGPWFELYRRFAHNALTAMADRQR
jgi:hypothetical protein